MRHWWANQNQTYIHEVRGGYMWSPKTTTNGRRNPFYDSMTETAPGDVVFSFCDTYIKAVGVVVSAHQSAPKPDVFDTAANSWGREGWLVPVRFVELGIPIRPKDHMVDLGPTLPAKYSPLQPNGNGNQVVYLAPVPDEMALVLRRLLGTQVESIQGSISMESDLDGAREQERIERDPALPNTEREQLIKARVGQGLFRSRVCLMEPVCRVTGVSDHRFLRASHIKPWSKSLDSEKLDGCNGLMLSPHVDFLFDQGFITFNADGTLLTSNQLPRCVQEAWKFEQPVHARPFAKAQLTYLDFHRAVIFKA